MNKLVFTTIILMLFNSSFGQSEKQKIENPVTAQEIPLKLVHAEPLYIDLIRDLGAHKGEKEWNLGYGLSDNQTFDSYEALVEYEWAVIDRLGLEIEVPFEFFSPMTGVSRDSIPANKMEGLQLATQWTFLVSKEAKTSLALGYIHLFEFSYFKNFGNPMIPGMAYNPFLVAAKVWGSDFHSLIYTGPVFNHHFSDNSINTSFEINTNFHYMIPNTNNFVGVEFNKEFEASDFDMTIRPQMRLGISEILMLGFVTGIPVAREEQGFSMFARLIWEPHP